MPGGAIVLGAETAAGRALAGALAERGAPLALVAAKAASETAFAVQRLASRLGAQSQAINATNEMAVRVMVRQVAKALGGLDLLAFCADLGDGTGEALALAVRFASREMSRSGGGTVLVALPAERAVELGDAAEGVAVVFVETPSEPDEGWARDALARLERDRPSL